VCGEFRYYSENKADTPSSQYRRIVLFSGGPKENDDQVWLDQVRAIRDGGGSGSILGRNVFQREKTHALQLLNDIIKIYNGEIK
jgi:fructose-bisphosphate aldolase, class I